MPRNDQMYTDTSPAVRDRSVVGHDEIARLPFMAVDPLALTEVPPYQDLPNHLAAVTVIQNPDLYPEFVFNGFFKTNAALFTFSTASRGV